ncbi:MAG TPA: M28 family peptidase [Polyangiaceae bacterium]|jgi:Tol biopolymer transport system component
MAQDPRLRPFRRTKLLVFASAAVAFGGACIDEPPPVVAPPPAIAQVVRPDEGHLTEVRALTVSGANDRPRWSWDGKEVILQTGGGPRGCSRVARVNAAEPHEATAVADGRQPAFLPVGGGVVYAAGGGCPKAVDTPATLTFDPDTDVFRAKEDGSDARRLTETPGFDGEPAVCGKTGTIVFTSVRDGDLDLYRMDADGAHVRRITSFPGYDGGAVFDADCSHIAWHAWHPRGKDLEAYTSALTTEHRVRPATLELWYANADGTEARQVTYLESRSFEPTWYPAEKRLLFSSTFDGESPRDVDLWAVDVDGTNLERVSTAPGPDDDPSFAPDGASVAFTSARGSILGSSDTNVFVARWAGTWRHVEERTADHLMGDVAWLADGAREGRGLGSKGLADAGAYLERSFESFGLTPAGDQGFREPFDVTTKVSAAVTVEVAGVPLPAGEVSALGFSASSAVEGPLVFVGSDGDYGRVDVKGRIVVARARTALRHSAWLAREHGAVGFLAAAEGAVPAASPESSEGIAAAIASSAAMAPVLAQVVRGQRPLGRLAVTLAPEKAPAFNVVAKWPAATGAPRLPGVVVVAAHYDGVGERSPGADDDASGTAALLQVARSLGERKPSVRRDILLVGLSGEEQGAAGASAFVKHPPGGLSTKDVVAMIDLDIVGRLRDDSLQIFGIDTAAEWAQMLSGACAASEVTCFPATGGGAGGEDRRPFFEARVPAIQLFTGVHPDLGKASDTVGALNATGMAQVARIAEHVAVDLADLGDRIAFQQGAVAPGEGDERGFVASLGTFPDAAGPPAGQKGMLLAGVRAGGPADKAGLRRGDVLVRLGKHVIGGIDDVKFVLTQARPGTTMKAAVLRDGTLLSVDVTLDVPPRR